MIYRLMSVLLVLWTGFLFADELDTKTKAEIDHLFSFIEASPCEFNRNGTWYTAPKAGEHIKTKYEYLFDREMVSSTEAFIELAATKSSMSGEYYLVKCGNKAEIRSADWLKQELSSFRSVHK